MTANDPSWGALKPLHSPSKLPSALSSFANTTTVSALASFASKPDPLLHSPTTLDAVSIKPSPLAAYAQSSPSKRAELGELHQTKPSALSSFANNGHELAPMLSKTPSTLAAFPVSPNRQLGSLTPIDTLDASKGRGSPVLDIVMHEQKENCNEESRVIEHKVEDDAKDCDSDRSEDLKSIAKEDSSTTEDEKQWKNDEDSDAKNGSWEGKCTEDDAPRPPNGLNLPNRSDDPILHQIASRNLGSLIDLVQESSFPSLGMIRDDEDRSVLHYAIGIGDFEICNYLLSYPQSCGCPSSPSSQQSTSRSPSISPTHKQRRSHSPPRKQRDLGLWILLYGYVAAIDAHDRSLLHYVCHSKNASVCQTVQSHLCIDRILKQHVALLDRQDKWGIRPLGYAAMRGNHEAILWCFHLGCGKDYNAKDVHRIMEFAEDRGTKKLLLRGFEQLDMELFTQKREALSVQPWLEYFGEEGHDLRAGISLQTPLHRIAQFGSLDACDYALECHVDINAVDANGWTALHYCAACENVDNSYRIAERLLACESIEINIQSSQGNTPLHIAASNNHAAMVALLLQQNADALLKDEHGFTPLLVSAHAGATDAYKALVESDLCNPYDTTPTKQNTLHLAARGGHDDMIAYLCAWDMEKQKLRVAKDCNDRIPLQVAKSSALSEHFESAWSVAYAGQPEKLARILKGKRCLYGNVADRTFQTQKNALHLAVMGFHALKDQSKQTQTRYLQTIRKLQPLIDPTEGDHCGVTPLMLAASIGNVPIAQALNQLHALDIIDNKGNTALHYAYAYCHSPMARWIESLRPKLTDQENHDQQSPLDVAGWKDEIRPKPCIFMDGKSLDTDED